MVTQWNQKLTPSLYHRYRYPEPSSSVVSAPDRLRKECWTQSVLVRTPEQRPRMCEGTSRLIIH